MSLALFFVNRYLAFLVNMLYAVLPSPTTPKVPVPVVLAISVDSLVKPGVRPPTLVHSFGAYAGCAQLCSSYYSETVGV